MVSVGPVRSYIRITKAKTVQPGEKGLIRCVQLGKGGVVVLDVQFMIEVTHKYDWTMLMARHKLVYLDLDTFADLFVTLWDIGS